MSRRSMVEGISQRDYGRFVDGLRITDPEMARRLAGIVWRLDGACAGMDSRLWFTERSRPTNRALALCQACPVRRLCLASSLAYAEEYGVWGGFTPDARAPMLRASRRGIPVNVIVDRVLGPTESTHAAAS